VLVSTGQDVGPQEVVARAELPGPPFPVNAAASLGVKRAELAEHVVVKLGHAVTEGQVVARSRSLFGLLTSEVRAPVGGVLESVSSTTGQLLIRAAPEPIELTAYLPGKVVEVEPATGVTIEGQVSQAQGIFGLGGEVFGPVLRVCQRADATLEGNAITPEHSGAVVIGGGRASLAALERARSSGVSAVVAGSARGADLIDLVGGELNPAATGDEQLGFTLVLTEGFGDLPMAQATFELLGALDGQPVSVSGTTQVRAGVIRPEILGPGLDGPEAEEPTAGEIGARVRIVRGERFGTVGRVSAAPDELREIESGALATVYEVNLSGGETVVVPRANVEHLGYLGYFLRIGTCWMPPS
jgi:hypothetical protein